MTRVRVIVASALALVISLTFGHLSLNAKRLAVTAAAREKQLPDYRITLPAEDAGRAVILEAELLPNHEKAFVFTDQAPLLVVQDRDSLREFGDWQTFRRGRLYVSVNGKRQRLWLYAAVGAEEPQVTVGR